NTSQSTERQHFSLINHSLLFFLRLPLHPTSTLFPYTTLFRSFFSGGVRRIASHPPSGLKANDWIPSTVVSSPVARLRRPILLGMGFLSFFSFSSCDSEMPME